MEETNMIVLNRLRRSLISAFELLITREEYNRLLAEEKRHICESLNRYLSKIQVLEKEFSE